MHRHTRILILLAVVLSALAPLCATDLRIEQEVRVEGVPGAEGVSTQVLYFSGKKVRTEMSGQAILLDSERSVVTILDDSGRTYMDLSMSMLSSLGLGGGGGVGALLGQSQAPEVRETGRTRTIGEWEAREVQMVQSLGPIGTIRIQAWVATELELDKGALKSAATALGPLLNSAVTYAEMPGWPVETRARIEVMGQVITSIQKVLSIEQKSLPSSLFEVPAGYEKRELDAGALGAALMGQ